MVIFSRIPRYGYRYNTDFENQNYFAGLIGLISGLGAAMAYLFVTQLGQLKEPVLRTIFYFHLDFNNTALDL